jgi:hypothetical protein
MFVRMLKGHAGNDVEWVFFFSGPYLTNAMSELQQF